MSRSWCRTDPVVRVDGVLYMVTGEAFVEELLATARFDIYVKDGLSKELVFDQGGDALAVDYQGVHWHTTSQDKVQFRFGGTPQAGDEHCDTKMLTDKDGDGQTAHTTTGTIDAQLIYDYSL